MNWRENVFVSWYELLQKSWSEQKQISLIFWWSFLTCRHPSDVFIPNSAARKSSSAEKHRRLDLNFKPVLYLI